MPAAVGDPHDRVPQYPGITEGKPNIAFSGESYGRPSKRESGIRRQQGEILITAAGRIKTEISLTAIEPRDAL